MSAPSLFDFATSELSQDALLAWWLSWASPEFASLDPTMHRAGWLLLSALFEKARLPLPPRAADVIVRTQVNNIDILVTIGGTAALVIEDKVHTSEHSDQLNRYKQAVSEVLGKQPDPALFIYLKTGEQADFRAVERAGYTLFSRADLLRVMADALAGGVSNAIFLDYFGYLQRLDGRFNAWTTKPVQSWHSRDLLWTALFNEIMPCLPGSDWGWVNNAAGGFFAMWWGGVPIDGGSLYLQADSWPRLSVRVAASNDLDESRRPHLRRQAQSHVVGLAATSGLSLERPPRPRAGATAEVARHVGEWLAVDQFGLLDLDRTIANLQRMSTFLNSIRTTSPYCS